MKKTVIPVLVLVICMVAWTWADSTESGRTRNGQQTPSRVKADAGQNQNLTDGDTNLLAMHDPSSSSYDGECLSCHSSVLTEQTQDPRILSFHQAMLTFTPGYNPRHGATNDTCVQCHGPAHLG